MLMPRIQKQGKSSSKLSKLNKEPGFQPIGMEKQIPQAVTALGVIGPCVFGSSVRKVEQVRGHEPKVTEGLRCKACWVATVALILYGVAGCAGTTSPKTNNTAPPATLWSAGMETGDLSEWFAPSTGPTGNNGGDIENSGTATAVASTDVAHTGNFSAKLTITTPSTPDSGTRLFRWLQPQTVPDLYYRAWYYFPQLETPNGNPAWWNVMRWKSGHLVNGQKVSDPFFVISVGATTVNGQTAMYFYLCPPTAAPGTDCDAQTPPYTLIPVGQWVELEAHYVCAGDNAGHVTIWQDGSQTPLFDIPNVQTRYADGDCGWSVNNYSSSLNPATATIYVDDTAICSGARCS